MIAMAQWLLGTLSVAVHWREAHATCWRPDEQKFRKAD
jgi:hypothetical protein